MPHYDGLDQINRGFTVERALSTLTGKKKQRLMNSIKRIERFEHTIKGHLATLPEGRWYLTLEHVEAARQIRHPSQQAHRDGPTQAQCRKLTAEALNGRKTHLQRMEILMSLPGVGAPVASLLLAMVYPETYATIDRRAYRQLYRTQAAETAFTVAEYLQYNRDLTGFARMLGLAPHRLEQTLFAYDFCVNEAAPGAVSAPPGAMARAVIRLADRSSRWSRQLEARFKALSRTYGWMPRS